MRRYIASFDTWASVQNMVESIQRNIDLADSASLETKDVQQQQAEVDAQVSALNADA
jgi:hypothetical protein